MVEQVRRFNRTVTQRVGALDDHFLSLDRPLGEARVLWEIGAGRLRGARAARPARARLRPPQPAAAHARGRRDGHGGARARRPPRARRAADARRLAELAELDRRSDALAASLLAPLTAGQRERLVGAMRDVERLLTAAMVEIRPVDPEHPDARQCLRSYFAELERRSGVPFDPHSARPPSRTSCARRRARSSSPTCAPSRSGAARSSGPAEATVDIKRMWVAEVGARARPRAPAARRARGARRARRCEHRPARDQRDAGRGDRALSLGRLRGGPALQRRAVRRPLVREAPELRVIP